MINPKNFIVSIPDRGLGFFPLMPDEIVMSRKLWVSIPDRGLGLFPR